MGGERWRRSTSSRDDSKKFVSTSIERLAAPEGPIEAPNTKKLSPVALKCGPGLPKLDKEQLEQILWCGDRSGGSRSDDGSYQDQDKKDTPRTRSGKRVSIDRRVSGKSDDSDSEASDNRNSQDQVGKKDTSAKSSRRGSIDRRASGKSVESENKSIAPPSERDNKVSADRKASGNSEKVERGSSTSAKLEEEEDEEEKEEEEGEEDKETGNGDRDDSDSESSSES